MKIPKIDIPTGPFRDQTYDSYFMAWAVALREWADKVNELAEEECSN